MNLCPVRVFVLEMFQSLLYDSAMETRVQYFGLWHEESKDHFSRMDYFKILKSAVERCVDEDCRTEEVFEALDWLAKHSIKQFPYDYFRKALDLKDPFERYDRAKAAYRAMQR